jgi:hypothetical protein
MQGRQIFPSASHDAVGMFDESHDQAHRRAQPMAHGLFAQHVVLGVGSVLHHVRQPLVVDPDQQVDVQHIAADRTVHPLAARPRPVEVDLRDSPQPLVRPRAQHDGVLEVGGQDFNDMLQLCLVRVTG